MKTQKNHQNFLLPWIMWGVSLLFYFYEFVLQVSPGVFINSLVKEFHLSATAIGEMGAVYFYVYATMQMPVGLLLDYFGERRVLTSAVLFCALGTLMFSFATSFSIVLFARFFTALGSAFAMVGSMKVASTWLPESYFGLLSGLILLVGMAGAIFGKIPVAYAVSKIDWQNTLVYLGLFGLLLSSLIWFIIRDKDKASNKSPNVKSAFSIHLILSSCYKVLKNKQTWLIAVYGGLMISPVMSLGALWGEKYLIDAYSYTQVEAAASWTTFFIGMGVGAPVAGWLSDWTKRRKLPIVIAPIGSCIALIIFIYTSHFPDLFYTIVGFLIGFFTAFSWAIFALVSSSTSKTENGTALGFVNFFNVGLCATAQLIIGTLLDLFHKNSATSLAGIYTEHDYELAFMVFPIFTVIAFILTFFIREKRSG